MVILGLLILLVAIALGTLLVIGTSTPEVAAQDVEISLLDTVQLTLNPMALVIAGMVAMFLAWLGLVLIRSALNRKARARRERKEEGRLAQQRRTDAERDRAERDRQHEEQLKEQRMATETARERAEVAEQEARRSHPEDRGMPGSGTDRHPRS